MKLPALLGVVAKHNFTFAGLHLPFPLSLHPFSGSDVAVGRVDYLRKIRQARGGVTKEELQPQAAWALSAVPRTLLPSAGPPPGLQDWTENSWPRPWTL